MGGPRERRRRGGKPLLRRVESVRTCRIPVLSLGPRHSNGAEVSGCRGVLCHEQIHTAARLVRFGQFGLAGPSAWFTCHSRWGLRAVAGRVGGGFQRRHSAGASLAHLTPPLALHLHWSRRPEHQNMAPHVRISKNSSGSCTRHLEMFPPVCT